MGRLIPVWAVVVGLTAAVFVCWLAVGPVAPAFTYSISTDSSMDEGVGVVIIAPEGGTAWRRTVESAVSQVGDRFPLEIAFGTDPVVIHVAAQRLMIRGVERLVLVPLFVSSHSSAVHQIRFIMGLASTPASDAAFTRPMPLDAPFALAGAMDDNSYVAQTLTEKARSKSTDPANDTVVIAAEVPADPQDRLLFRSDVDKLAASIKVAGGFRRVIPGYVSSGDLRRKVEISALRGHVVVVPLSLGDGSFEERVSIELRGLRCRLSDRMLPSDPGTLQWIREDIDGQLIKLYWERLTGGEAPVTS